MTATLISFFFWFFVFILFYTYFGYGLLVWVFVRIRDSFRKKETLINNTPLPTVAFIIPCYNEEVVIAEKIVNTSDLNYPNQLLQIIVISDGSGDNTANIVKQYPHVQLLNQSERKGKSAALNRAVMFSGESDIVVFSDANTVLNKDALLKMMVHYGNEEVGAVSGEKKVISGKKGAENGESLYWRYESRLKHLDSQLNSVAGGAGELFSMRKNLYQPLEENTILDDFVLSFRVCMQGFTVKYEPGAIAIETPSLNLVEEEKRKIRIGAGAFQAMKLLLPLFNIFRYGIISFQFISRRVLRWVVCPLALPVVFILNVWLVLLDAEPEILYKILMYLQLAFYLISIIGGILAARGRKVAVFYIAFYFLFMNFSIYLGFARYLKGGQSANWEKSKRAETDNNKNDSRNT